MARRSPIVRTSRKNVIPLKLPLRAKVEAYAVDTGDKLSMLQDICVKLVASGRHVTMSTQHVDNHLLDDLRHELIRQGVMVKTRV